MALCALPALGQPSPFSVHIGIEYLFMAVLGGAGYVWGAVPAPCDQAAGGPVAVLLPALIGTSGSYEVIVFGVLLVMV